MKRFLFLVLIVFLLTSIKIEEGSMDKILVNPWPCSTSTEIGGNLPADYEPSGVAWSPLLNNLFLVSDNGQLTQLDSGGNIIFNWSPGWDLEGVTLVEGRDSYVYLGVEQPDSIREFNLSTGALTDHSWSLTPWMTGPDNQGLEALTFVPNGYHPYASSTSGGLFYAGLQADGRIYVFDVNLSVSGSVTHVATLTPKPGMNDISGLYYCKETGVLYATYDTANLLVEMKANGNVLAEYALPGNDQEGVTIVPTCENHQATVYIAEDIGPELWRYEPYPILCSLDTTPPATPVKLVFIHHSCGDNWLENGNGNLGTALNSNNYYVTETNYGWDAEPGDNLGSSTDTSDWPLWFNGTKMPYVYANNFHYAYTNTITDPGGENEIIMFKSCYPNSEVGESIDDEKAIYNNLLSYIPLLLKLLQKH